MMSSRLITLDKQLWVRSDRVGETWQRLMERYVLRVTGQEVKAACEIEQLASGIKSGI